MTKKNYFLMAIICIVILSCKKHDDSSQGVNEIRLEYKLFHPSQLSAVVGSTIIFKNNDNANHTPLDAGNSYKIKTLAPGETYSLTINKPGTYSFSCGNHSTNKNEQVYILIQ